MSFANKLKAVKKRLVKWNKEIFGKVDQKVRQAKDKVLEMEVAFVNDPTESNKVLPCKATQELDTRLQMEEIYWRQKANIKCIKEGDLNTKNFHQSVRHIRQKLFIHQIRNSQGHAMSD